MGGGSNEVEKAAGWKAWCLVLCTCFLADQTRGRSTTDRLEVAEYTCSLRNFAAMREITIPTEGGLERIHILL